MARTNTRKETDIEPTERHRANVHVLQSDVGACNGIIDHLCSCTECTDEQLCPIGRELQKHFELAKARAERSRGNA